MAEKSKVTRITAKDESKTPKTVAKATKAPKATKPQKPANSEGKSNLFVRIGRYFKGAWTELRQVRWPTRKATWSLTLAVLIFSAFFVVVILLLDTLFKYLFELIIT